MFRIILGLTLFLLIIGMVSPPTSTQVRALGLHDVGISNASMDFSVVCGMLPVKFTITLVNYGNYSESCNVTLYANKTGLAYGEIIATTNNVSLPAGNSTSITIACEGLSVSSGYHLITAYVVPVKNETGMANNVCTAGTIRVTYPYDANGDGMINVLDLITVATKLGQSEPFGFGYPIPIRPDVNGDGKVDLLDLISVARWLGAKELADPLGGYVCNSDWVTAFVGQNLIMSANQSKEIYLKLVDLAPRRSYWIIYAPQDNHMPLQLEASEMDTYYVVNGTFRCFPVNCVDAKLRIVYNAFKNGEVILESVAITSQCKNLPIYP